jgi:hypothetical protein
MISERGVAHVISYWAGNTCAAEVATACVKVHLYPFECHVFAKAAPEVVGADEELKLSRRGRG